MDMMTKTKARVSYAHVLVEVDVLKELVRSVKIRMPDEAYI